jgi:hypothetical protein
LTFLLSSDLAEHHGIASAAYPHHTLLYQGNIQPPIKFSMADYLDSTGGTGEQLHFD